MVDAAAWANIFGPFAAFIAFLIYMIIRDKNAKTKQDNGDGHITAAEFRANVGEFQRHHVQEDKLLQTMVKNSVSQTEVMRNMQERQNDILERHETDMRAIVLALGETSTAMKTIAAKI